MRDSLERVKNELRFCNLHKFKASISFFSGGLDLYKLTSESIDMRQLQYIKLSKALIKLSSGAKMPVPIVSKIISIVHKGIIGLLSSA